MTAAERGPWIYRSGDESQTEALGTALGQALVHGGVVALVGPLGAGKTRLVQAVAAALGADRRMVNSPTFVLIQEYEGEGGLPISHCDTYRLRNADEFLDLGVDEMFASPGVVLIEWADRVASVLPSDRLQIEIAVVDTTVREFTLKSTGPASAAILESTAKALGCAD